MGKYLDEIDLLACNLYEREQKIKFLEETAHLLESLNSHFRRNIYSSFGKVVIMLWPEGKVSQDSGLIPRYEYDKMSNVAVINIEYDLSHYMKMPSVPDKNLVIYNILKEALSSLPDENGLDGQDVIEYLDKTYKN